MPVAKRSFSEKMQELEELLNWFEGGEVNVEEAIKKYEAAIKLAKELEKELKEAKNKVEIIKQNFA
jgi:exodeoxyribonuclease VII small subunit